MQPDRSEVIFKLVASLLGLCFVGVAIYVRGIPNAPAMVEVFGIAGLFFGGTIVWCLRKLRQMRDK